MLALSVALTLAAASGPAESPTPTVDPGRLRVQEAVARTLAANPAMVAAAADEAQSAADVLRARGAFLPRLDFAWTASRGDDPVYAFGSKLRQGRFTEEDFALDALNHPDPISDYRSELQLEQVIYDGGRRWLDTEAANISARRAAEVRRRVEMDLVYAALATYFGIKIGEVHVAVLDDAVDAASQDLERAAARRDAGQATEAEVLSIRVHRADLTERRIRAASAVQLGRIELNRLMAEPLDRRFELTSPVIEEGPAEPVEVDVDRLESLALQLRPHLREARLSRESADNARARATSGYHPVLALHAGHAWHSPRPFEETEGNWLVALSVRLNLFNRLADRAAVDRAAAAVTRRDAELKAAEDEARVEVRRAATELDAAAQRVAVAEATIQAACESHRITTHRYEAGLATVTDQLRSQNALLDAEARKLRAHYEHRLAANRLDLVVGQLGAAAAGGPRSEPTAAGEPAP